MTVRGLLSRAGTSRGDIAIAMLLTAVVLSELHGDVVANAAVAVAVTAPVLLTFAWRRRFPGPVLIAICLLNLWLSATAPGEFPPQLMTLAIVAAVANAAVHLGGRAAAAYGATSLVLIVTGFVASNDGDLGDFLPYLFWGVPWVAARLVRRRTAEAVQAAAEAERRAMLSEAEAQEAVRQERDRIARELHDVVAHAVSVIVVQAGAERLSLGGREPGTRTVLENIEATGRSALSELRVMLTALREPEPADPSADLLPQPRLDDVASLIDRVRAAGLEIAYDAIGRLDDVPAGVGLATYRVVQESLTNVLKHGSGPAEVLVTRDGEAVTVQVSSPMRASAAAAAPGGRGLVGIHERVEIHGGSVMTGPVGSSWVVRASLPVASQDPVVA
jgi:signal transduction histidine kinase